MHTNKCLRNDASCHPPHGCASIKQHRLHHHLKCELYLEFSIITSNDGMIVTILMIGRTSGMSSIITAYLNSALGCCAGLRHGCVTSGAVYARVRSATVVGALCTALVSIAGAVMQPG